MKSGALNIAIRLLLAIGLLHVFALPGQAQSYKQFVKMGDAQFKLKDYYNASYYFGEALKIDSGETDLRYKIAECQRYTNDYKEAVKSYRYVTQNDDDKAFPLAVFYLGEMLKYTGNYAKAIFNFQQFSDNYRSNDYYLKKAIQELASCYWAQDHAGDSQQIVVEHLQNDVNTNYSDFAASESNDSLLQVSSLNTPLQTGGGGQRYFSRIRFYNTHQNETEVTPAFLLSWNEKQQHIANGSFSADNERFYFTVCDNENEHDIRCAIYVSTYRNGVWSEATKLDSTVNAEGSTSTHPYETTIDDKTYLFFSSNRPGGKGGMDVWYSTVENGKANSCINAGERVNTPDDEVTPYVSPLNKRLYFSSTWHYGYGGFDVFQSDIKSDMQFTAPVNLGKPINTSYNDLYFNYKKENAEAFITSNRIGARYLYKEACCNDIFTMKWSQPVPVKIDTPDIDTTAIVLIDSTVLKEKIIEQKLKSLVPVVLFFHNDEPNPRSYSDSTDISYADAYNSYIALKPDYETAYKNEDIKSPVTTQQLFANYVEPGMKKLTAFTLLMEEALKQGRKVEITIQGYCSPLAKNKYNIHLAGRRIASLKNYFFNYNAGYFLPYLQNGSLQLLRAPFGEEKADQTISDDRLDLKNSVYNPRAALERRVEIIAVELK